MKCVNSVFVRTYLKLALNNNILIAIYIGIGMNYSLILLYSSHIMISSLYDFSEEMNAPSIISIKKDF